MKRAYMILLLAGLVLTVAACKNEEAPVVPPPTPGDANHQVHSDAYKRNAVWGAVTSGGAPLAGAFVTIVKKNEKLDLEGSGEFAFTLDAEEYGESPHELLFGKPGYKSQTHTVTIVPAGVELNVDLKPE